MVVQQEGLNDASAMLSAHWPQVSAAGQVQDFLMDSTGQHVSTIASVTQKGSRLYMGSLAQSYIAYLDLPELGADDAEADEE